MKRPLEAAKSFLAYEIGAATTDEEHVEAAVRVFEKLHVLLDPLLGLAGTEALFVRSGKFTQNQFACLGDRTVVQSAANLRECLRAQQSGVSTEVAAALFGSFLALLSTFIGEQLTTEVLRSAWPVIDESVPKETKK